MENQYKSFSEIVNKSNKILLTFPYVINPDTCVALGLVYKLLTEKLKKEVTIASSRNIPSKFYSILERSKIDPSKILLELQPLSYVIHINDAKDEKIDVKLERKDNKTLDVVLTPENIELDLEKVSFSKEGGIYDLIITFNAINFKRIGSIGEQLRKRANQNIDVISFDVEANSEYAKLTLNEEESSTLSEVVYKLYKSLGFNPSTEEASLIAEGILGSTYGLHRIKSNKTLEAISEITNKYKVDVAEINTKYFYSLNEKGLKIRERLLQNVKLDNSSKVIYSSLSAKDFTELSINPDSLEGVDYLPFNVCQGFDYAFLAYEKDQKSHILIHSNSDDKDLNPILNKLNGFGNKNFGLIIVDAYLEKAINEILTVINPNSSAPQKEDKKQSTVNQTPQPTLEKEEVKPIQEVQDQNQTKADQPTVYVSGSTDSSVPTSAPTLEQPSTQTPVIETPKQTQEISPSSPFTKSMSYVEPDDNATPAKEPERGSYGFTPTNKPFDKADETVL